MKKDGPIQAKQDFSGETGAYRTYFNDLWKEGKPLGKLFMTDSNGYLYDAGTNKVLRCEAHVFELLNYLFSRDIDDAIQAAISKRGQERFLDAAGQIKDAVETEKVLLTNRITQFGLSDHYGDFKELIDTSLWVLTLEVTERCNLRCGYCLYNSHVGYTRDHGSQDMSLEVAYRAIDHLKEHSGKKERVAITFYGGEPLLRFPFLKSCVSRGLEALKDKEIDFNITTNGTLLTDEIIDFFRENNFAVTVSLDGPKEIHDNYRKDIQGEGSYDRAVSGLKKLVEAYGEKAGQRIMLSMVYTPPYSGEKIDRIACLWKELPWLPKNMNATITYPLDETVIGHDPVKSSQEEEKPLIAWSAEKFAELHGSKKDINPLARTSLEKLLAQFMQRPVFNKPFDRYHLNGCCVPGVRKLYVAVDGTLRVCERMAAAAPPIGNVFDGYDIDTIKNFYIDEYETVSLPTCSQCWAIRLCTVCYARATDEKGKFDLEAKENACGGERYARLNLMKLFCTSMEKDPEGLKYLYDFEVS